jgi:hypothetical protein
MDDHTVVTGAPGAHLPGTSVSVAELTRLGFTAFDLATPSPVVLAEGTGVRWTTPGTIPDSAGLYAFTVSDGIALQVVYVGMTSHLWMVVKGRLPGGQGLSRPGNRYSNPRYAGATRRRVNILVAAELGAGRAVSHWLCPRPAEGLRAEDEQLIARWNRG